MDLIYTDKNKVEQGVLTRYALDVEETNDASNCTLEVQTSIESKVLELGSYIYIEDTELGGIIDTIKIDTSTNIIYSSGRTWRGLLGSKIIEPSPGAAYYSVTGLLSTVLATVIRYINLDSVMSVLVEDDIQVSYKFNRYTDAYKGILKLLAKYDYKMQLKYDLVLQKVIMYPVPIVDYANESEISSDMFEFKIQNGIASCNHMIGLGSGTLEDRMVVHKYLQADGTIGDTQYYTGANEKALIYDYSSAESEEDLINGTIEELEKYSDSSSMEITAENLNADLGDKFSALDITTGLTMTQYVTKKITRLSGDDITYQYEVGDKIV